MTSLSMKVFVLLFYEVTGYYKYNKVIHELF